jgi:hypothetical protein
MFGSPRPFRVTFPSLPWCLRTTKTADQGELHGGACGKTGPLTFIQETGSIPCSYSKAATLVTYSTHPEDAKFVLTTVNFPGEAGNSVICPTSESVTAVVTLTINGQAAYIS